MICENGSLIDLPRNDVVCDILEWSCATLNIQVALEGSGYAGQISGEEIGRTRRDVVCGFQHLYYFEVLILLRVTTRDERASSNVFEREPYVTS